MPICRLIIKELFFYVKITSNYINTELTKYINIFLDWFVWTRNNVNNLCTPKLFQNNSNGEEIDSHPLFGSLFVLLKLALCCHTTFHKLLFPDAIIHSNSVILFCTNEIVICCRFVCVYWCLIIRRKFYFCTTCKDIKW